MRHAPRRTPRLRPGRTVPEPGWVLIDGHPKWFPEEVAKVQLGMPRPQP